MPNLYPFLAYVFVTTFTPGPNNILSMTNGLRYGYRRSLRFLVGIATGFLVVMLMSGLLNIALVNLVPPLRFWFGLFGAAYMLYLAVHIALSKPAKDDQLLSDFATFRAGFALQFVNLKGILYGITVFATFITPNYHDLIIVSLFAILLTCVAFAAVSSWALGGNIFQHFLHQHERGFNLAMAALLVYTAIASLLGNHV